MDDNMDEIELKTRDDTDTPATTATDTTDATFIRVAKGNTNKTMTAKTASEDILSGIMLMHAVIRLLKLDTTSQAGKIVLGLTIVSMIVQVVVITVLLVTIFLNYDDPKKRPTVDKLTKVSTTLIVVLAILETTATGVEAYVSGAEATTLKIYKLQQLGLTPVSSNQTL